MGVSSSDLTSDDPAASDLDAVERARRARIGDLSVLFVVPFVLVAVFALPIEARRAYAFSYTEPTVVTAFTAHYVHLTPTHLAGNLVGFVLLASVAYRLSVVAGRRRLFFTSFVTFLLAFPFVLSGLNLAIPRDAVGFGFSGINMALLGYVSVVLVTVAEDCFGADGTRYGPALFFASTSYIVALVLPPSVTAIGLAAIGIVVAIPYGHAAARRSSRTLRGTVGHALATPGYSELLGVCAVVLLAYPIAGFPRPTPGGPRINVYVHFLGYALAFLVVHVFLLVDRRVPPVART
ncbi:hypothetical protein [Halorubrum halodurans]|uniref:Peptidase S54 rhomboid domain-containing protein n=1 Tax=Halorubrum halodurans TaxID=1383851 RepID=A0A256IS82_9EURY|nr:hypothetical protein [Halorubrum halodurans]OYR59002.1 hypothetical protein DJ70_01670 [Halorubrum halodurans]